MELQSCINYLLTMAQHKVYQKISAKLDPFGITPGQYGILNYLWENGPGTPKELSQVLGLETSTVSGVLDRMQKKGLIDRLIDLDDRRSVQVTLTEESEALKDSILQAVQELNVSVLSELEPAAAKSLLDSLRIIGQLD